jgi:serine/threonine-protein kinase
MLDRPALAAFTRFAWSAADVVLLTALLWLADPPRGPLLVGYPLLIAASGLFFQVPLVWFTTTMSLASYAALLVLHPQEARPPHYALIFAATLAVLGFIVAYQVYRVRALSRYFENRTFS